MLKYKFALHKLEHRQDFNFYGLRLDSDIP